jgi:hypothetical protein
MPFPSVIINRLIHNKGNFKIETKDIFSQDSKNAFGKQQKKYSKMIPMAITTNLMPLKMVTKINEGFYEVSLGFSVQQIHIMTIVFKITKRRHDLNEDRFEYKIEFLSQHNKKLIDRLQSFFLENFDT